MKKLVFILLFALSASVYGQIEALKDSFPPLRTKTISLDEEKFNQYLDLEYSHSAVSNELLNLRSIGTEELILPELNLPPLDVYVGPPLEANTFTRNPFANDYSFYGGYTLSDNLSIGTSSIRSTYPTLGGISSIDVQLNYQPVDWLRLSAGSYGAKYQLWAGGFKNDVGVNGSFKLFLSDRIRLNGYAQYSAYGKKNGVQGPSMGMFPQTYYGGTIEVKINEKFGVEGGLIREYNPFNGKWVNQYRIAPVFYVK